MKKNNFKFNKTSLNAYFSRIKSYFLKSDEDTSNYFDDYVEIKKELIKSNYVVSLVNNDKVYKVNLDTFNKDIITFGSSPFNDIVIDSSIVSNTHGYFKLEEGNLSIYDNDSLNGILIDGKKVKESKLDIDSIIRIDNDNNNLPNGIILIISKENPLKKWKSIKLSLLKDKIIKEDETLANLFTSYKIVKNDNIYQIEGNGNILINNKPLEMQSTLKDNDIINDHNNLCIFKTDKLIYEYDEIGIRINAENISKTVFVKGKKREITQNVSMIIEPGEFISFVGGSGAGKSTFLKFLCGINKPTRGNIYYGDLELFSNYNELKDEIAYVPQDDIVFTNLTMIDMLRYSAKLRLSTNLTEVEKESRVREAIDIVDLNGKENVMIRNLSGGQRKRVGIAVELLADPKIFFLDEPTSGLDPGSERNLMNTLKKMSKMGKTIILVTHNTLNLHLCDRVAFFGTGGILTYIGAPEEAKKFFGVNDFVEIYNLISSNPKKWNAKLEQKDDNFLESIKEEKKYSKHKKIKAKKKPIINQFLILVSRYAKTILNNPLQMCLLLFQGPIIALALTLVITKEFLTYYEFSKSILFAISCAGIYIGFSNSIQEICKERVILVKEYISNLRLSAYVSSKVFVQLIISILQSLFFITTLNLVIDVPTYGIIFPWNIEMIIIMTLTIFGSATIGLVISTIAPEPSVAMTYIPILLLPQMLYCGMLFELKGLIEKISSVILCRWSLELFGITNDMNNMISSIQDIIPGYIHEAESFYDYSVVHFNNNIIIMLGMSLFFCILCYVILKVQLRRNK